MIDFALDQEATIYTENANSGRYTTVANPSLKCRLMHIPLNRAQSATSRAELAGNRHMMFDAAYVMDERAQVEVDGVRWQPTPGTFSTFRDWNSVAIYRSCDLVRQD